MNDPKRHPSDEMDKFMLRLPHGMRHKIKELALQNRRTMGMEILARLEKSLADEDRKESAPPVIRLQRRMGAFGKETKGTYEIPPHLVSEPEPAAGEDAETRLVMAFRELPPEAQRALLVLLGS